MRRTSTSLFQRVTQRSGVTARETTRIRMAQSPLSRTRSVHGFGDSHGWLYPLLWSYGAREVEADGKTVAIDSAETARAIDFCREFYEKHFDARGYLRCFVRWGANDGPDDAFENFNGWPELHALGADDVIRRLYEAGHEGLLRQYTEARTVETPIAREGMYHREFIVQSDWMHHGEGLQLFHRMNLSLGADERYADRARRFAGFYMGTDPAAPNYDPSLRLIRSMLNGAT